MSRTRDKRQMAFDFDAVDDESPVEKFWPVTSDMVAAGRAAMMDFDAAVRAGDYDAQALAHKAFRAAASAGQTQYLFDYGEALHARLPAIDGEPFLFGQAFDRVIHAAGIDVRIKYEGMGMLGLASAYALDTKPFISHTGFQSLSVGDAHGVINSHGLDPLGYYQALVTSFAQDKKTGKLVLKPLADGWVRGAWRPESVKIAA